MRRRRCPPVPIYRLRRASLRMLSRRTTFPAARLLRMRGGRGRGLLTPHPLRMRSPLAAPVLRRAQNGGVCRGARREFIWVGVASPRRFKPPCLAGGKAPQAVEVRAPPQAVPPRRWEHPRRGDAHCFPTTHPPGLALNWRHLIEVHSSKEMGHGRASHSQASHLLAWGFGAGGEGGGVGCFLLQTPAACCPWAAVWSKGTVIKSTIKKDGLN